MPRNLDTRVELLAPVEDAGAARPSCSTRSSAAWPTTRTRWELGADGGVDAAQPGDDDEPRNVQRELMARHAEHAAVRAGLTRRRAKGSAVRLATAARRRSL